MRRRSLSPRRVLGGLALALFVAALLPARHTGFASFLREPVRAILTPAAAPMRAVGLWIRPPQRTGVSDDPAVAAIEEERDRFYALWRRSEQTAEELAALVVELQRGRALNPEIEFAQIVAPVVGSTTERAGAVLQVRAGRDRGVTTNSVAVYQSVHIVGRAVEVGARVSDVVLVTNRRTGWLRAAVDPGEGRALLGCQLQPVEGEELLRGELDSDVQGVEVGMLVRLTDESWPRSARMLVLGRVVRVEPKETQPLRMVVTVRPEADLRRLSQVILHTPTEGDGPGVSR